MNLELQNSHPLFHGGGKKGKIISKIRLETALKGEHIPHICHKHHKRCLCKFFLPGVIFFQIEREKLVFYCIIIRYPLCNITQCMQCIILYTECNLHSMCNYTHNNVTQRIPSFYTQCVVLHTVCNLTNFMYFLFFPKPIVLLHSVCSFTLSE